MCRPPSSAHCSPSTRSTKCTPPVGDWPPCGCTSAASAAPFPCGSCCAPRPPCARRTAPCGCLFVPWWAGFSTRYRGAKPVDIWRGRWACSSFTEPSDSHYPIAMKRKRTRISTFPWPEGYPTWPNMCCYPIPLSTSSACSIARAATCLTSCSHSPCRHPTLR